MLKAGLFGAIVTAFVLDGRKDLLPDSEQQTLIAILRSLNGLPQETEFHISAATKWRNGLWIASLAFTLECSIMIVLAKDWLAKWAPVLANHEANSKGAFERFKLDKEAKGWYLEEVVMCVPLLLEIATLFFAVGLVIQIKQDDETLGNMVLSLVALGATLYAIITVLPLRYPAAPFNTPFSKILLWIKEKITRSINGPPDSNTLATILHTKLLESTNPSHVDEAIAEISTSEFPEERVGQLASAAKVVLGRFRQLGSTRTNSDAEETLCTHMLALLRFVYHRDKSEGEVKSLQRLGKELFDALLDSSTPLRRWNSLRERLRPLLFALRTQIITLTPPFQPTDFTFQEVQDRPWEIACLDIDSSQRFHFASASCRGLVHSGQNLKTICSFALSISFAKGEFQTFVA